MCACSGDVGDVDRGLATPLEVFQGLALEGYQLTYQRVPLSRERTPEAADLDALHRQALLQPGGAQKPDMEVAVESSLLSELCWSVVITGVGFRGSFSSLFCFEVLLYHDLATPSP